MLISITIVMSYLKIKKIWTNKSHLLQSSGGSNLRASHLAFNHPVLTSVVVGLNPSDDNMSIPSENKTLKLFVQHNVGY